MIKLNRTLVVCGVVLAAGLAFFLMKTGKKPAAETVREIRPVRGAIQTAITATAIVQPQNRLEIKPPINGRVDRILVKEGEQVSAGQTLAWMSSTERAALLDAARGRGAEAMQYWEEVYKPTPLISPINGEVIVSIMEPGQTVTSSDAIVVLSDRLIVQAQVDETDIGRVALGQEAEISLDADPEIKVRGKVDHIYYESKLVNNVTIYQVDILTETVPPVFRSGMSANAVIVEKAKEGVLLIPADAVRRSAGRTFVLLARGPGAKPVERDVELGISDEKNSEVLAGLGEGDAILAASQKYTPQAAPAAGKNPFMPTPRRPH